METTSPTRKLFPLFPGGRMFRGRSHKRRFDGGEAFLSKTSISLCLGAWPWDMTNQNKVIFWITQNSSAQVSESDSSSLEGQQDDSFRRSSSNRRHRKPSGGNAAASET